MASRTSSFCIDAVDPYAQVTWWAQVLEDFRHPCRGRWWSRDWSSRCSWVGILVGLHFGPGCCSARAAVAQSWAAQGPRPLVTARNAEISSTPMPILGSAHKPEPSNSDLSGQGHIVLTKHSSATSPCVNAALAERIAFTSFRSVDEYRRIVEH